MTRKVTLLAGGLVAGMTARGSAVPGFAFAAAHTALTESEKDRLQPV